MDFFQSKKGSIFEVLFFYFIVFFLISVYISDAASADLKELSHGISSYFGREQNYL